MNQVAKPEIAPIFPTPIYTVNYGNIDKELELVKQMSFAEPFLNFNQSTKDSYILNKIEFSSLKKFLLDNLKIYAETVLETAEELYIHSLGQIKLKKEWCIMNTFIKIVLYLVYYV